MMHDNLVSAEKITVGGHWYALVNGTVFFGLLDQDQRPSLDVTAPIPPLGATNTQAMHELFPGQWEEIDVAQRALRAGEQVRNAVKQVQSDLSDSGVDPLAAKELLQLVEPTFHREAIVLVHQLARRRKITDSTAYEACAAIVARDHAALTAEQRSFLEQLLLEEINDAADHIVNGKPYYEGGPVPDKRTMTYEQLRAVSRGERPTSQEANRSKADALFPTRWPRVPLPAYSSKKWVRQCVLQAAEDTNVQLPPQKTEQLVSALLASSDVWATLLEHVADEKLRDNTAAHLCDEDFMNWEANILDCVREGLEAWLFTAGLEELTSWTPLQRLHPSDWRTQFADLPALDIDVPIGWLDHSRASDGCASFRRGRETLYVQFPGVARSIALPGGGEGRKRFVLDTPVMDPEHYETDDWIEMLYCLEHTVMLRAHDEMWEPEED